MTVSNSLSNSIQAANKISLIFPSPVTSASQLNIALADRGNFTFKCGADITDPITSQSLSEGVWYTWLSGTQTWDSSTSVEFVTAAIQEATTSAFVYKGTVNSSSTASTFANAQVGWLWRVTEDVTILGTALSTGDYVVCHTAVTGTPANLDNFDIWNDIPSGVVVDMGALDATGSADQMADAVRGYQWHISVAGTLLSTTFLVGDIVQCTTTITGTPANLNSFIIIPGVNSLATKLNSSAFTDSAVTGKLLTGYSAGSNTDIAATDTILQAFGKTQGQFDALGSAALLNTGTSTGNVVQYTGIDSIGSGTTAFLGLANMASQVGNNLTIGGGLQFASGTNYNGSAARQITIDSTVATLTGSQTLTNKTISGSNNTLSNIGNGSLTNSSITINGNSVSLGGSTTVTASTTNALTVSTGLQLNSGTTFDGSAARTISIDSTVATLTGNQTLTNKTLTSPTMSSVVLTDGTVIMNSPLSPSSFHVDGGINFSINGIGAGNFTLNLQGLTSLILPTTGTLATLAGSEDLTNKTVNGLTISSTTGTLTLANGSTLATSGANSITLTSTGSTNVTLPTSGTLVNTAVTTLSSLASVGTITTGTWNATTIGATFGGTGQTTYATGDTLYASATNTLSKLAGNTTTTKMTLTQTGNGSASAAPVWQQLSAADLSDGTRGTGPIILATSPTISNELFVQAANAPLFTANVTNTSNGAGFRFQQNGTEKWRMWQGGSAGGTPQWSLIKDNTTDILSVAYTSTDVTVNTGNLLIGTVGKALKLKRGGTNSIWLTGGTMVSGVVTFNTTAVSTGDFVMIMKTANGGTDSLYPTVSIVNGTSVTLTSNALNTSTYDILIFKQSP